MNFALAHSSCGKISRSVRSEAQQRSPSGRSPLFGERSLKVNRRESKPSRFRKAYLSALDRLGQFRSLRRLIGHRPQKLRKSSIR
jgi:hypothetical protein